MNDPLISKSQPSESIKGVHWLIFIIWPMLGLILGLVSYKKSKSKWLVWAFAGFYGLVFVLNPEGGSDSLRYAEQLDKMYEAGWDWHHLYSLFFITGGYQDIYQPIMTFFVSRFTANYQVLSLFIGLFLGYFYASNLWFVLRRSGNKLTWMTIFIIFVFAFIVHLGEGLNSIRMWTAAHVFLYGCLYYFVERKKWGVLVALLSILIHFSFLLPSLLLIIFVFFGKYTPIKVIYIFFVISYFVVEVDFEIGRQALTYLPEGYEDRASGYVSVYKEQQVQQYTIDDKPWYFTYGKYGMRYSILLLTTYIVFFGGKMFENSVVKKLLGFGILLYSVANIFEYYPSLGRFISIAALFLFPVYVWFYQNSRKKSSKWLYLVCSPALLLYVTFQVRMFLEYPNYLLLIGNPIVAAIAEVDQSIYQLFESIL